MGELSSAGEQIPVSVGLQNYHLDQTPGSPLTSSTEAVEALSSLLWIVQDDRSSCLLDRDSIEQEQALFGKPFRLPSCFSFH